ncbi:unnamed protein product [Lupinus luteus]|uniref:C2H2-type domain-containing protein n=1 Tax=Lupinus luteus TaxID=3873 RepID=A0AAV1YLM7_LUPLU
MEESEYLMWMNRKEILKSHLQGACNNKSWEERAFAEDAERILGGCIWPPRSYSCNFCKRDFRSAQALGGHMNIHRRDRARLKQNHSPHHNNESTLQFHHHHKNYSSEAKVQVNNVRKENFKGFGCNDYVETSLSVGLNNSVFEQKSAPTGSCDEEGISYKRPKTCISSIPIFRKPCSEFVLGLETGLEDLDLELRLGEPQIVEYRSRQ